MQDAIYNPWPWYVVGPLISLTMYLLIYFGKRFGVSSTLRATCSALGAGKSVPFFDFNWRDQNWNIVFVLGAVIGGFLSSTFLEPDSSVELAPDTVSALSELGFQHIGESFLPEQLFSLEYLTWKSAIFLLVGGFFVGFGARYAGGCTSGHAISGLSNLQLPSLIAVIGFFIGGLVMTYFLLPVILPF